MPLKDCYLLPAAIDCHSHLRDGDMSRLVVPTIRSAGIDCCFVMPNLSPRPILTVAEALDYQQRLRAIDPDVEYLMSLYLHPSITPETIREAKKSGIAGVKAYPRGATTNSEWGVTSFDPFHDVLATMEDVGMVLNLHGEVVSSSPTDGITPMNAEARFLPKLKELHQKFPRLKIVLEHVTSADAVDAVKSCGENVVATVTAHHVSLLSEEWEANAHCFCKPSAKTAADRKALLNAVVGSRGKFFLGTDSAPHDVKAKTGQASPAAGVFTQPYALGYVLGALEAGIERGDIGEDTVTDELLSGFFSEWGRSFYGIPSALRTIMLKRDGDHIVSSLKGYGIEVVPYRAGEKTWTAVWQ